jgi:hypothetical protein
MSTASTLGFTKPTASDPAFQTPAVVGQGFDDVDEHLRLADAAHAWQAVALGANFANVAGFPVSRYRKLAGDRAVRIEVTQTRSSTTHVAGTTICTLSAGYRPTANQIIVGYLSTGASAQFTVGSTGALSCTTANITAGTSFVVFGEISLD